MPAQQYQVRLDATERARLRDLVQVGSAPARAQTHARILLKADRASAGPALTDTQIANAVEVSARTVQRVRQAWVLQGFDAAVYRTPPSATRPCRLDGEQEAQLVALACSTPPAGHQRWTLRLLAARLVELELVEGIAPNTVRSVLKKTSSSPG
jgi:transposase